MQDISVVENDTETHSGSSIMSCVPQAHMETPMRDAIFLFQFQEHASTSISNEKCVPPVVATSENGISASGQSTGGYPDQPSDNSGTYDTSAPPPISSSHVPSSHSAAADTFADSKTSHARSEV